MPLIDPKLKRNWPYFLLQCGLASLAILVVLVFLDTLEQMGIIAALGATTFIVFAMPLSRESQPRRLLGGYAVGIGLGVVFHLLIALVVARHLDLFGPEGAAYIQLRVVAGAAAVGLSILLMTMTNTEHPPAAGMALGLVLNEWGLAALAFVLAAILVLSGIKYAFRHRFIDLM